MNTISFEGIEYKFNEGGDCRSCDLNKSGSCLANVTLPCLAYLRKDGKDGDFKIIQK